MRRIKLLVLIALFPLQSLKAQTVELAPYLPKAFDFIHFYFESFELYAQTEIDNFVFIDFGGDDWRVRPSGDRAFSAANELGIAFREKHFASIDGNCSESGVEQVVDYYRNAYHVFRLRIRIYGCDYETLTREELIGFDFEKLRDQSRFDFTFGRYVFPGLAAEATDLNLVFEASVGTENMSIIRLPKARTYIKLEWLGEDLEYEFSDSEDRIGSRFRISEVRGTSGRSLLLSNIDGRQLDPSTLVSLFSRVEEMFKKVGSEFLPKFKHFYEELRPEDQQIGHN